MLFVQARQHGGRGNVPPTRIVIHATVSPTVKGGARAVARYFAATSRNASAHYVVDPGEIVQCATDDTICYHAPPNRHSLGVELCDPQTGSGKRWGDADHEAMLERAAGLVRDLAARYGIPVRRLSPTDLRAGRKGICGHVDVTNAWHRTSHTDPGPDFPWDHFLNLVEDNMPTADEVAKATVDRLLRAALTNSHDGTKASVAAWLVYGNEKAGVARDNSAAAVKAVDDLRAALNDTVAKAATDAVKAAIADGTLTVNITVTGAKP
jgi:N-acetyl-anhydromuramyl-L-alanine amidase AmpD